MKLVDENWESIAPTLLNYYDMVPKSEHASLARKIRQHYLGDNPVDRKNLEALTRMVGDRTFSADSVKAAKLMAARGPVWFYHYTYRAATSTSDAKSKSKENLGKFFLFRKIESVKCL